MTARAGTLRVEDLEPGMRVRVGEDWPEVEERGACAYRTVELKIAGWPRRIYLERGRRVEVLGIPAGERR